jgi:toxin co-regulated pilus biosynthesis protein T
MLDKKRGKKITIRNRFRPNQELDREQSSGLTLVSSTGLIAKSSVSAEKNSTGSAPTTTTSRQKIITESAQIPTPDTILSGVVFKSPSEDKRYLLGEIVQNKAIVFKTNSGAVWLLAQDDIGQEELLDLAATKTEIRKAEEQYVFAKCPATLFQEFVVLASEFNKKKQALASSDQHIHFENIVLDAVGRGVSDIHITTSRGVVTVEYRIDSRNQVISKFGWSRSVEQTTSLVRSIYNTIAEGNEDSWNPRVPQDASIVHAIKGKRYQLRYAHDNVDGDGFHCVLRVLDDLGDNSDCEEGSFVALQKLGLYDDEVDLVNLMLEAPYGFLCVSGTTGSGKSTFLKNLIGGYAFVNQGKNVISVENPVEYRIFNVKQTSVSDASKMGVHLVSALRRDPDAIFIGEIRDIHSAKVSIEATQTGHYVWSTLHASNALAQVSRLEDIGVSRLTMAAPEFLAGMVHLALARKVCPSCRIHINDGLKKGLINKDRYERVVRATDGNLDNVYIANIRGCSACTRSDDDQKVDVNSGFKGRMSVPEMIIPNIRILKSIKAGDDLGAHEAWRETGGKTLQEAAIRRLMDGYICANEIESQFKRLNHDAIFYA